MTRKSVDGRVIEFDLAAGDEPGTWSVSIGDRTFEARSMTCSDNCHIVEIDGVTSKVLTATTHSGTWVWCRGKARLVQDAEGKSGRSGAGVADADPGLVSPPMPSVVTAVLVEVGQEVEKGQGLVVLTAMKMETRLSAGFAGRVVSINTEVGANVMPGERLVELEPLEDEGDG